jgi:hypothetical protein
MFLVKVIFVILCCGIINCNFLLPPNEQHTKIALFVKNLISDLNSKNYGSHDVALLKLGLYKDSKSKVNDIYEELVKSIDIENVQVTSELEKMSKNRYERKPRTIIIVSDAFNTVS